MSDGRYPDPVSDLHLTQSTRLGQLQRVVAPFGAKYNGRWIHDDHDRDQSQINSIPYSRFDRGPLFPAEMSLTCLPVLLRSHA